MANELHISCVIPAHNEERSIENTLRAVIEAAPAVHEIIVVDDGSTDGTRAIVARFPQVRLVVNEKNIGKSRTLARGVREARGNHILMLDADLVRFDAKDVRALVRPLEEGRADAVISIRENTPGWMKKVGVDFMSGERVLPKALFAETLPEMESLPGYGLEVFLNRHIIAHKLRIASVAIDAHNPMKWEKRGLVKGVFAEAGLWLQVFRTASPVEAVLQNVRMRRLLVKTG